METQCFYSIERKIFLFMEATQFLAVIFEEKPAWKVIFVVVDIRFYQFSLAADIIYCYGSVVSWMNLQTVKAN